MTGGLDVDVTQELPIITPETRGGGQRVDRQRTSRSTSTRSTNKSAGRRTKVSRWDRPPPPKDWRYFVGGLGQIFIALGLLTFGFVGYQLWGTGIETARTQAAFGADFQRQVTESPPPSTIAVPAVDLPPERRPLNPEITEVVPAEEQTHLEVVDPGAAIMKIEIPKIGVDWYVFPTVSRDDLKKGVGHFPETAMPGQLGNAAFAGHRTTYGGPFYHLDKLEPGDRVIVTRLDGNQYSYQMTDSEVVDPDTYNINSRLNPQVAGLTLMTCTPVHSATNRLIIYGELVPSESGPVGEATFYKVRTVTEEAPLADEAGELAETESTDLPAAQPIDDPDASATDSAVDTATVTDDPAAGAVTDPGAVTATTVDEAVASDEWADDEDATGADSWSGGWFEDRDAWPQIAMWGAAVLGLYILFRLISRWTRHYSVGFLICITPFAICLYFFYQNVNRLLPPGI